MIEMRIVHGRPAKQPLLFPTWTAPPFLSKSHLNCSFLQPHTKNPPKLLSFNLRVNVKS